MGHTTTGAESLVSCGCIFVAYGCGELDYSATALTELDHQQKQAATQMQAQQQQQPAADSAFLAWKAAKAVLAFSRRKPHTLAATSTATL